MGYPPDIYMSPRKAISRFHDLVNKYGSEEINKSNPKFKVEKELLATAEFILGLQKLNDVRYFFQPGEHISPAIDVNVITMNSEIDPKFERFELQITEYESHGKSLIDTIKNKVKKQAPYGKESRDLLVKVRGKGGETFYPDKIAKEVESLNPTFTTIWLLMDDESDEWTQHLILLWPNLFRIDYSLTEEFDEQAPPDWIQLKRGAKDTIEEPLGDYDLPLP